MLQFLMPGKWWAALCKNAIDMPVRMLISSTAIILMIRSGKLSGQTHFHSPNFGGCIFCWAIPVLRSAEQATLKIQCRLQGRFNNYICIQLSWSLGSTLGMTVIKGSMPLSWGMRSKPFKYLNSKVQVWKGISDMRQCFHDILNLLHKPPSYLALCSQPVYERV